jgi:hypothetical protein
MKEYIEKISNTCLSYLDGSDLFVTSTDSIERACISFLEYRGYRVNKMEEVATGKPVKDIKDLIDYFYTMYKRYHPDVYIYRNREQDLSLAASFVEARQVADELTKEQALKQCAAIIQVIFEEEERFHFTMPVTFGVFGQKNCGWITEVAVRILNERIKKAKEEEDLIFANAHADKNTAPAGWDVNDIEEALKKLEGV